VTDWDLLEEALWEAEHRDLRLRRMRAEIEFKKWELKVYRVYIPIIFVVFVLRCLIFP
jgi:hypothetical protein